MAKHFETLLCQAKAIGITRDFKLYVRRSDERDLVAEDHNFIRHWASQRVHNPVALAVLDIAATISKQPKHRDFDQELRSAIYQVKERFGKDELPGMKEYPVFIPRFLEGGKQISYEVFESNY